MLTPFTGLQQHHDILLWWHAITYVNMLVYMSRSKYQIHRDGPCQWMELLGLAKAVSNGTHPANREWIFKQTSIDIISLFLRRKQKILRDFLALLWMQLSSCRTAPKLNAKPAVCSMKGSYFSPAALSLSLFDFAVFVDGLTRHSSSCNLSLFFFIRLFDSSNDGEFFRCFQLGDEKMDGVKREDE